MVYRFVTILALLAAAALPARAAADAAPPPPELSAENLRAFADDFVATTMARFHAPGAACVIVKDGRLVYSRGYGFADLAKRTPVDPARTRFAVGSISKLLTSTAVMQLVERGELSLDADVAPLLAPRVRIDNPFGRAVTLRQLLTHTGGFDQRYLGIGVRDPARVPRLEDFLRAHPPVCVMRPGEHISYSEEGYALAGYLIERQTGRRFERYAEERVLGPLGMDHSGFATGAPSRAAALAAGRAVGYEWDDDARSLREMPALYVKAVPCAGLIATPEDLGRFMVAHLDVDPRGGDAVRRGGVLRAETVRLMHERQFGYDPNWDGMTLGFFDRRLGSGGAPPRRVLAHGGVGPGMTSNLFLLPDERVGCYFVFNVYEYRALELPPEAFARHFFPDPPRDPSAPMTVIDPSAAAGFAGRYRHVSYARRTIEKVQYLTEQVEVRPGAFGTLVVSSVSPSEPGPQTFAPSGPGRFRQVTGDGRSEIGFRRGAGGAVTHLLVGAEAYERLAWAEDPALHRRLFKACAALFVWAGLGWPLLRLGCATWVRRHHMDALAARARRTARADRMLAAACVINLLFLVGFGFVLLNTTDDALVCGPPTEMRVMLVLPPMAALLTLAGSARAARLLADHGSSLFARLHRAVVALAAIGFLPLLAYWNLLGFNY